MAPPFVIIDGYNLLHTLGTRRSLGAPGNLARARQALAGQIAAWMDDAQCARTTIVFDANAENQDQPNTVNVHGITLVYAKEFDDADTMIAHLLKKHSNPKSVIVVSNDRQVQQAATRRRALAMNCEAWFESLKKQATAGQKELSPNEKEQFEALSLEERAAWVRAFSTRPPAN